MPQELLHTTDSLITTAETFHRLGTSADGRSPVDPSDRICTRFVVRLVPWPLIRNPVRSLLGGVLVVGHGVVAKAIYDRLVATGVDVSWAPPAAAIDQLSDVLPDSQTPPRHLIWVMPSEQSFSDVRENLQSYEFQAFDNWGSDRESAVRIPYYFIQRWYAQNEGNGGLDGCSLVGVTALGTPGGLADGVTEPAGGAMTGLIKGIAAERRAEGGNSFRAVVVDLPIQVATAQATDAVLDELLYDDGNVEVVYREGKRYSPRPLNEPLDVLHASAPEDLVAGAWVITGGARGVTAEVARGFVGCPGAKLHLLGSSPPPAIPQAWLALSPEQLHQLRQQVSRDALARQQPPAEAWAQTEKAIEIARTLHELARLGIEATYHQCDVGDQVALTQVLQTVRARHGGIVGVIHGAGFEKASRYSRKKQMLVDRTLNAKVDGAVALMQLTSADPLRYFIAFGSISGRFGAVGQSDYCQANECLAKWMRWYRTYRPAVAATTIAWHSWDQVGMAVRPESKFSKSLQRLRFMPPGEGVAHLFAEISRGCPEPEVIITDWRYFKLRHPDPLFLPPLERFSKAAEPQNLPLDSARSCDRSTKLKRPATSTSKEVDIASRYVLRMRPAPVPDAASKLPPGPVLILGDNPDATSLQTRLRSHGIAVDGLAASGTAESVLAKVQRLLDAGRAASLLVMTARESLEGDLADEAVWSQRRSAGVMIPYFVVQKWFAHHAQQRSPALLAGVVSLGGDFGFSSSVPAPEGGAIAGLLKTVRLEAQKRDWSALRVGVVDASRDLPAERLADLVLQEPFDGPDPEVGFDARGQRSVVAMEAQNASTASGVVPERGSVWVAIGGGRGITAKAAFHLAATFGVRMHLLGSGPPPNLPPQWKNLDAKGRSDLKRTVFAEAIAARQSSSARWFAIERAWEIEKTLQDFAAAGLSATYHQCDASDRVALAAVLQRIRQQHGPIDGILQGAGKFQPTRFETKTPRQVEAMVSAKLDATVAAISLTTQDPLRWFIGFNSIGGRFGTNGNTDYAMASEMQCKLIGWLRDRRPGIHATGFHWHAWDEVGMMMSSGSFGARNIMKLALMPPVEGGRHLERELRAGAPESELVITDSSYRQRPQGGAFNSPAQPVVEPVSSSYPLIDAVLEHVAGTRLVAQCHLNPQSDPFLTQHRFRGQPLVPFAIAVELLVEAAAMLVPDLSVTELRDFEFLSGIKPLANQPMALRVRLTVDGDEGGARQVRGEILSDFVNRRGQILQRDRVHAKGQVILAANASSFPPTALQEPGKSWLGFPYPKAREAAIEHGPVFRRHRGFRGSADSAYARIVPGPPEEMAGARGSHRWLLPPDVTDACLLSCGVHSWLFRSRMLALPTSCSRLIWSGMPQPGQCYIQQIHLREQSADRSIYDFTLSDKQGNVIARGERLVLTSIGTRGT